MEKVISSSIKVISWVVRGDFLHLCMPHYMCHLTPVDSLSELQFIQMQNRANDSAYLIGFEIKVK